MKTFNTTGKCIPSLHYMVDISRQVEAAAQLVRGGNYFCINRGRRFGKTTTLSALKNELDKEGYYTFATGIILMQRWNHYSENKIRL